MNVVIEDKRPSRPTLKAGDVVALSNGHTLFMVCSADEPERLGVVLMLSGGYSYGVSQWLTSDAWIRIWSANNRGYTIYSSDEYELALRRKEAAIT